MITYRQYRILKALVKLYENEKIEEERKNKINVFYGGQESNIAHINIGINKLKSFLQNKYPEDILIFELHNLGEMGMVKMDPKDKENVLYYSILNKGKAEVTDYFKNLLKNWVLPILVSVISSVITTLIVNCL